MAVSDTDLSCTDKLSDVDKLSDLLCSSTVVSNSSRISQYKSRIRDVSSQEERRQIFLEHQKEKRQSIVNSRRNIEGNKDDELGIGITEAEDEDMDCTSFKKTSWHQRGKSQRNRLMFSEWLIDIPMDLSSKWIAVPCPVGKRSLIITRRFQKRATCYTKSGFAVYSFKTLLPPNTIIDCISLKDQKYFYALDVIQWNGLTLKYCQTDFRFTWLDGQLKDNAQYCEVSDDNQYGFLSLPRCMSTSVELTQLMNSDPVLSYGSNLDGIRFYHIESHYFSGYTPLVVWLKPYMMPEALGVSVPASYAAPENFSFAKFVDLRRRKNKKMECEEFQAKSDEEDFVDCNDKQTEVMNIDVSGSTSSEVNGAVDDNSSDMDLEVKKVV